jgi:hypothetical protein
VDFVIPNRNSKIKSSKSARSMDSEERRLKAKCLWSMSFSPVELSSMPQETAAINGISKNNRHKGVFRKLQNTVADSRLKTSKERRNLNAEDHRALIGNLRDQICNQNCHITVKDQVDHRRKEDRQEESPHPDNVESHQHHQDTAIDQRRFEE